MFDLKSAVKPEERKEKEEKRGEQREREKGGQKVTFNIMKKLPKTHHI